MDLVSSGRGMILRSTVTVVSYARAPAMCLILERDLTVYGQDTSHEVFVDWRNLDEECKVVECSWGHLTVLF
jgi:hypothetical protein